MRRLIASAAAAATVALLPLSVAAAEDPGQGVVVGTLTSSDPSAGCTPVTLHQAATATIEVTYPEGSYVGPVSITADISSDCGNQPFLVPMTMSIAGSNDDGDSFSCRAPGSTQSNPAPMPGAYADFGFGTGLVYYLSTEGTCTVNGVDTARLVAITEFAARTPAVDGTSQIAGPITLYEVG